MDNRTGNNRPGFYRDVPKKKQSGDVSASASSGRSYARRSYAVASLIPGKLAAIDAEQKEEEEEGEGEQKGYDDIDELDDFSFGDDIDCIMNNVDTDDEGVGGVEEEDNILK